jgi:hypothetical protein
MLSSGEVSDPIAHMFFADSALACWSPPATAPVT